MEQQTEFDPEIFGTSLNTARAYVLRNRDDGVQCPCCDQYVKVYKRPINSSMAYALIIMDRYYNDHPVDEWLHVEDYLKRFSGIPAAIRGDFHKLRYWGLIEAKQDTRDDGSKRNGFYRITEKGRQFVRDRETVPSHVLICNKEVLGFGERVITIKDALGVKFDYNELMGAL
jgi:hypothetical protein